MSRRVIAVLVCLVVGGLLFAALRGNWLSVWGTVRQPTMYPSFADLRAITGAVESAKQGFDPMVEGIVPHEAAAVLSGMRQVIAQAAERMPLHGDFIQRYCDAGHSQGQCTDQ